MNKRTVARKKFFALMRIVLQELDSQKVKANKETTKYIRDHMESKTDEHTLGYATVSSLSRCILQAIFVKIQNLTKELIKDKENGIVYTRGRVNSKLGYEVERIVYEKIMESVFSNRYSIFKDTVVYNNLLAYNEELKIKTQADIVVVIDDIVFFIDVKKYTKEFTEVFETELKIQQYLEKVKVGNTEMKIDYVAQLWIYLNKNKQIDIRHSKLMLLPTTPIMPVSLIKKHKNDFKSIRCKNCSHNRICPLMNFVRLKKADEFFNFKTSFPIIDYEFLYENYTIRELIEFFRTLFEYVMTLDKEELRQILMDYFENIEQNDFDKFIAIVAKNYFDYLKSKDIITNLSSLKDAIFEAITEDLD